MTVKELGAILRSERERRGLSLEDVSEQLKFKVQRLQDLESGNLDALSSTYIKGMIKTYAAWLGLSTEEVVEAMQVAGEGQNPSPEEIYYAKTLTRPVKETGFDFSKIIPVVAALGIVLIGFLLFKLAPWQYLAIFQDDQPKIEQEAEQIKSDLEKIAEQKTDQNAVQNADQASEVVDSQANNQTNNQATNQLATKSEQAELAQESAEADTFIGEIMLDEPVRIFATTLKDNENKASEVVADSGQVLVITAKEDTRISYLADRERLRTLQIVNGESFSFFFKKQLSIDVSPSNALEVQLNGVAIPEKSPGHFVIEAF